MPDRHQAIGDWIQWRADAPRPLARPLILAASVFGVVVLHWRSIEWLVRTWRYDPYYNHGLLVAPIVGYLAWRQRTALREARGSLSVTIVLLASGVITALLGSQLCVPTLSALSLLLLGLAAVSACFGSVGVRRLGGCFGLLALTVPLPGVDAATAVLRRPSAHIASGMLRLIGVNAQAQGPDVRLRNSGEILSVGPACSGMRSVLALTTFAAVLGVYRGWGLLPVLVLTVAALPIALLANGFRLAILSGIAEHMGAQAVEEAHPHVWLAVPVIGGAGVLLVCGLVERMIRWSAGPPATAAQGPVPSNEG